MKIASQSEGRDKVSWILIIFAAVVVWPIAILIALIYFGYLIRNFLKNIRELSFKLSFSGIEFTAKTEAVAGLPRLLEGTINVNQPADVSQQRRRQELTSLNEAHILWVDDMPTNNAGERAEFEQQGVRFTISTSTEDALEKVRSNSYDAIISDMGRPPDNKAGYTLLSALQEQGVNIPFVIYSGSNLPKHKAEARRRGAIGSTSYFPELRQLGMDAIVDKHQTS